MAELEEAAFQADEDVSDDTWTTKNGRVLKIRDMTDEHLLNTINYLRRRAPHAKAAQVLMLMHAAVQHHGEGAADAIDRELDGAMEMHSEDALAEAVPAYAALCEEAEERGLYVADVNFIEADKEADKIVLSSCVTRASKKPRKR